MANLSVHLPHLNLPSIHGMLMHQMGGFGNQNDPDPGRPRGAQHPQFPPHNRRPPAQPVTPTATGPTSGPEQWGQWAVGIDPTQMGVDKSLRPGTAFKGTKLGGGGVSPFLGSGGLGGLLGGGLNSGLMDLLRQLLPSQDSNQPIAGGIR